jgi:hypothetical protein
MTIQARFSEHDPRMYSVARDVAHNFGYITKEVADRIEDRRWGPLQALLDEKGITLDQLGAACESFCKYLVSACEIPKESMGECLQRSGFYDVPDLAQIAYMAYLGTVVAGVQWLGVRQATVKNSRLAYCPVEAYGDLVEAGRQCHRFIVMSRWRRWLYKIGYALRRAWRALFGKEHP